MKDSVTVTNFSVHPMDMERDMAGAVKTEMQLLTSTGRYCLQKVYGYAMSMPATSVEAERAFSAADVVCALSCVLDLLTIRLVLYVFCTRTTITAWTANKLHCCI